MIRSHCQIRDVSYFIKNNSTTVVIIDNLEYLIQALLWQRDLHKFVHLNEVHEGESANLLSIVITEDAIKVVVATLHALIELCDPLDKDHSFVALLLLEVRSAINDTSLKVLVADRKVLAFIRLDLSQAIDLILCEACLQTLQTLDELLLVKAASLCL